jgi:deoxyribonuclease-4
MVLGAHEPITGGVSTAFARAEADGADCLQVFTRNARGWAAKLLEDDEISRFRAESRRTRKPVVAHSSYLINCASADRTVRRKSWAALADELGRCRQLGVSALVFHPGSHENGARGVKLVAEAIERALDRVPGPPRLLIENTAGQGSCLGWRFEQVAEIRAALPAAARRRTGVCVDTCHLFAAGYDIRTEEGTDRTLGELDEVIGLSNVRAFHLNDSQKPLGSRVDRHAHIGRGAMGLAPFRLLVNDPRFADTPGVVETDSRFKENIEALRNLVRS